MTIEIFSIGGYEAAVVSRHPCYTLLPYPIPAEVAFDYYFKYLQDIKDNNQRNLHSAQEGL